MGVGKGEFLIREPANHFAGFLQLSAVERAHLQDRKRANEIEKLQRATDVVLPKEPAVTLRYD